MKLMLTSISAEKSYVVIIVFYPFSATIQVFVVVTEYTMEPYPALDHLFKTGIINKAI